MNTRKFALLAVVLAALSLGGYFWYQDYEYRQVNGQVTEVSLLTWDQEVDGMKDNRAVLVYFYKEDDPQAKNDQLKVVQRFAWDHARQVKVVGINCSHVENLPLALAHGAFRFPAFAAYKDGKQVLGSSGGFANEDELKRLIEKVNSAAVIAK